MRRLASYSTFGAFANAPRSTLAERLAAHAPVDDARVFLGSGGGDAIDTAAKLARRYFAATGQPERVHLIGRAQGYHGTHGLGTSIGGIPANREGIGPARPRHLAGPARLARGPRGRVRARRRRTAWPRCSSSRSWAPAACTSRGPATSRASPSSARAPARSSSSTPSSAASGGSATWFGAERFGVRPDMLCFAKGVTSGYLPLGGVDRRPAASPSPSGTAAARGSATARRTPGTRRAARRRWRTSTCSRARA